jgi:hypothetical protein
MEADRAIRSIKIAITPEGDDSVHDRENWNSYAATLFENFRHDVMRFVQSEPFRRAPVAICVRPDLLGPSWNDDSYDEDDMPILSQDLIRVGDELGIEGWDEDWVERERYN